MLYELMHKDTPIAKIEIDEGGMIKKLVEVINAEHFPFGTAPKRNRLDSTGLRRWWDNRRIPISRDDIGNLTNTSIPANATTHSLLLICKGLSLSDCYWIRQEGSKETFNDVSFFENGFSLDLGDVLFGNTHKKHPSFMSPDATSEGNLKKRWKIINGKRVLLKSGTPPFKYEVFNEVIASAVLAHLNIPHVEYRIVNDENDIYCACDDFVNYSQDFVTAYMIYASGGKKNDESLYGFFVRRYKELGIEEPEIALNQMLLVDYILGNEDRHLNNFGILRDAKTLEFVAAAPVFDTGSSLGFDRKDEDLSYSLPSPWKPFSTSAKPSQLDYIPTLPNVSEDALLSLLNVVISTCDAFGDAMPQGRKKAIRSFVAKRIAEVIKHFGIQTRQEEDELSKLQMEILRHISSIGGKLYLAEDLCAALGISRITAMRNLKALVEEGKLRRFGAKKNGFWTIPDKIS